MDTEKFYSLIRQSLFKGKLLQSQINGIDTLIKTFDGYDKRYTAYVLATAFHETAQTMQPIEEYGKGKGHPYGLKLRQNGKPYTGNQLYYGRGYVQLTWLGNYEAATSSARAKGHDWDFVNHPELCLQLEPAAWVCKWGMINGAFTGKKLSDYFNDTKSDPVNARRIINGLDVADRIAGYYQNFLAAMG